MHNDAGHAPPQRGSCTTPAELRHTPQPDLRPAIGHLHVARGEGRHLSGRRPGRHPPVGRLAATIPTVAAGLDRDGRRALLIDLDEMMTDYSAHVDALLDFAASGLARVAPAATRGLAGALGVYDVRHAYSLEALYETLVTGHVSSLDTATKRALLDTLDGWPHAREAYQPILELMGPLAALM